MRALVARCSVVLLHEAHRGAMLHTGLSRSLGIDFIGVADRVAPLHPPAGGDLCGPEAAAFRQVFGHRVEPFQPQMTHGGSADGT